MSSGHYSPHRAFVTEHQLQPNDVLLGRGAPISDNTGNIRFLALVRERCSAYKQASTRKEKDVIARQVASTILARNGLFLRRIDSPQEEFMFGVPPGVTAWTTADEKTVLIKVKQALRDRGLEVERDPHLADLNQAEREENIMDHDQGVLGMDVLVANAAATSMPEPTRIPGATNNTFQETPYNIMQQQRKRQESNVRRTFAGLSPVATTQFQFAEGNLATAIHRAQPPFAQLPHRPYYGQDLNSSNTAAGLNLSPDITTNANLQQLAGERLKTYFRTAAFPQDTARPERQIKDGELKEDQKLAATSSNNDTSGETALRNACQVCDMGQTPIGAVKLDSIELCLLSVLISRGLPTWSSIQFRNDGEIYSASNNDTRFPLTWSDVGNHLVQEVQSFLFRKTSKLFPYDTPRTHSDRLAFQGFVSRVVSMASAYSTNPNNLARMTVMLLEKLRLQNDQRQFAFNSAAAPAASSSTATPAFPGTDYFGQSASMIPDIQRDSDDQVDSPYGTQQLLQTFLRKELGLWGISLNIADDVGFPVPNSSSDFVAKFPQFGQHDVFSTAAVLDASGCLAVLSQVSLLTRLRLIFQDNSSEQQLISMLRISTLAPQWGTTIEEMALIDVSLLQALLSNGFSGLLDVAMTSDSLLGILVRHSSITKIEVEKRAVQLTFLLHQHVHSRRLNQITNEQSSRTVGMIGW